MRRAKSAARSALALSGARRHHVGEVRRLERAPWRSPAALDALRLERLAATVERAVATSPFYRELLGPGVRVPRSFAELATLPVTSKRDLRASDHDRASARSLLRPRRIWRTSGSSGEPYEFAVDFWYPDRHRASRAFVYLAAGVPRGARIVEIVPGWDRDRDRRWAYPTFDRTAVGYRRDDVADVVAEVRPQLLYGNRTHLLEVAEQLDAAGTSCTVPFLCSSSETLHPQDEARLVDAFGGSVCEVYGSTEASNIAYRLGGQSVWTVLEPRIVVEVLDAARLPVAPGGIGEIVVTTLTEPTSPLIRYATGDLARVATGPANGASGLQLAALEGRSDDSLADWRGRRVSFWGVATPSFWVATGVGRHVARWQVHQRADRSVRVAVELTDQGSLSAIRDDIVRHVKSQLGEVPVMVEAAGEIHRPDAGKFRPITSDAPAGAR